MNKFETFKAKLILEAENKAYTYLLSKYAGAKIKSSEASLEITEGPTSGSSVANGRIKCYASTPVLNGYADVGLNMTVNNNDVSIESEETVADKIENSLNSSTDYLPTEEVVTASLDSFRLIDTNEKYLKVAHPALEDAEIGVVGKNEYATSPNKAELLKSIVSDSIARTASYNYKIEFTGSFVEPKIEKQAVIIKEAASKKYPCDVCKELNTLEDMYDGECKKCQKAVKEGKKSWLTADLMDDVDNEVENSVGSPAWVEKTLQDAERYYSQVGVIPDQEDTEDFILDAANEESGGGYHDLNQVKKWLANRKMGEVSINENMPRAKMSGGVEQSMQAEQQKLAAEKDKLSNTAVNQLIPTLQSLGFGSARVSEVTPNLSHSDKGFDGEITAMTFLEDKTSTKLVAFPIKIKASQIELPKLPLVRELINKAIDLNERLAEQLTKEALLSLSSVDEKVEYEKNEVKAILEDKIEKIATENGLSGVQLVGPQNQIVLQKHLLPSGAENLEIGDVIFGDGNFYKLVDKEGMQNDKNSESSSLWKFVQCEPPKDKEPLIRIPE